MAVIVIGHRTVIGGCYRTLVGAARRNTVFVPPARIRRGGSRR
jgi:hypothetical protein